MCEKGAARCMNTGKTGTVLCMDTTDADFLEE